MQMLTTLAIAIRAILNNRLRSSLTMLGIAIGIAAVIALQAIGEGQKKAQLEIFEKMGANRIMVFPGWGRRGGVSQVSATLKLEDAEAFLDLPQVQRVSPANFVQVRAKYLANSLQTQVIGVLPEYIEVENYTFKYGEMFTASDVTSWGRVCILGHKTATDLFGSRNPVGEEIRLAGKAFRVIGVFNAKGDLGWFNPDEQIVVPLTTNWTKLGASDGVQQITLQARSDADLSAVEDAVRDILRTRHAAYRRNEDLFNVFNAAEMQAQREAASKMISSFLLAVGGIALFIGGVGIMNIMLVTVTERTREIGLRKAIGATPVGIMSQFLTEAIVLCTMAGFLGVAGGVGIAQWMAKSAETLQFPAPIIQQNAIWIAVGVSVTIGLIFGTTPALKASQLDPIRALRHE
ncbi:MAG: Macrolide export ATP-binding/permease protein MacB [bacterium]|nr:Macrolide export ATP-binding/permease protein MacB [bacterium]